MCVNQHVLGIKYKIFRDRNDELCKKELQKVCGIMELNDESVFMPPKHVLARAFRRLTTNVA